MTLMPSNWSAFAIAVVAKQAVGAVWYSQAAFGRRWSELAGVDRRKVQASLPRILPLEILAALVMAAVLLQAVRYAGAYGALSGGAVGLTSWLGFVAVSALNPVLYAGRPLALYAIDAGYWLVAMVLMGAILGVGW